MRRPAADGAADPAGPSVTCAPDDRSRTPSTSSAPYQIARSSLMWYDSNISSKSVFGRRTSDPRRVRGVTMGVSLAVAPAGDSARADDRHPGRRREARGPPRGTGARVVARRASGVDRGVLVGRHPRRVGSPDPLAGPGAAAGQRLDRPDRQVDPARCPTRRTACCPAGPPRVTPPAGRVPARSSPQPRGTHAPPGSPPVAPFPSWRPRAASRCASTSPGATNRSTTLPGRSSPTRCARPSPRWATGSVTPARSTAHPQLLALVESAAISAWAGRLVLDHVTDLDQQDADRVIAEVSVRVHHRLATGRRPLPLG